MQRPGNLKERFPGGFVNHHKTPCAVQACRRDHDILPSSADSDSLCPSIRVLSATRKRTDDFHKKQMSGYSQTRPSHPARQWGPACGNQVQNHRQRKALHIRHKDSSSDHTAAHEVQSLLSEVAALRFLWLLRGSFIPHPEAYLQAVIIYPADLQNLASVTVGIRHQQRAIHTVPSTEAIVSPGNTDVAETLYIQMRRKMFQAE